MNPGFFPRHRTGRYEIYRPSSVGDSSGVFRYGCRGVTFEPSANKKKKRKKKFTFRYRASGGFHLSVISPQGYLNIKNPSFMTSRRRSSLDPLDIRCIEIGKRKGKGKKVNCNVSHADTARNVATSSLPAVPGVATPEDCARIRTTFARARAPDREILAARDRRSSWL